MVDNVYRSVGLIVIVTIIASGTILYYSDFLRILDTAMELNPDLKYVIVDNLVYGKSNKQVHILTPFENTFTRWRFDDTLWDKIYFGRSKIAESTVDVYYYRTKGEDKWLKLVRKSTKTNITIVEKDGYVEVIKSDEYYGFNYAGGTGGVLRKIYRLPYTTESDAKLILEWIPETRTTNRMDDFHKLVWRFKNIKIEELSILDNTIGFGNISISWNDAKDKVESNRFSIATSYEVEFKQVIGIQSIDPIITIGPFVLKSQDFFIELEKNEAHLTYGVAIFKLKNPTSLDITLPKEILSIDTDSVKYFGATDVTDIEVFVEENETRSVIVYNTTCSSYDLDYGNGTIETIANCTTTNSTVEKSKLVFNPFGGQTIKAGEIFRIKVIVNYDAKLGENKHEWIPGITVASKLYRHEEWATFLTDYDYRRLINISNTNTSIGIASNYTINLTFDHASFVSAGKSKADGSDIEITVLNGNTDVHEIIPWVNTTDWNTATTQVWFNLTNTTIAASSHNDTSFFIWYDPDENGTVWSNHDMWLFWDDFEDGDLTSDPVWNRYVGNAGCESVDANNDLALHRTSAGPEYCRVNSTVAARDFPRSFALTWEAKAVSDVPNQQLLVGTLDLSTERYGMRYMTGTTTPVFAIFKDLITTNILTCINAGSDTAWHNFTLTVSQEGNFTCYMQDSVNGSIHYGSVIDTEHTAWDSIFISVHGTINADQLFDNIRVRSYITPEPTTTLGAEDTGAVAADPLEPNISFVSPTPANDHLSTFDYIDVNISANGSTENISVFIDFNYSLVGWWKLDNDTLDFSTYGNNGTEESGLTANVTGQFGDAYLFPDQDTSCCSITVDNPSSLKTLNSTQQMTVMGWFSNRTTSLSGAVVSYGTGANSSWSVNGLVGLMQLEISSRCDFANEEEFQIDLSSDSSTPPFRHITYTVDGTSVIGYIDGIVRLNDTRTHDDICAGDLDINIGDEPRFAAREYNGTLDEILIFNRILTGDEINATINLTSPSLIVNFTALDNGDYAISASITDSLGRTNSTELRNMTVNDTTPTISFASPSLSNGTFSQNFLYINVSVSDNVGVDRCVYAVIWSTGASLLSDADFMTKSTDGTYCFINITGALQTDIGEQPINATFNATVNDTAGNLNETGNRHAYFDVLGPVIGFLSPNPADASNQSHNFVYINVSAGDPGAYVALDGTDDGSIAVDTCTLEWDGVNETMSMNVTGSTSNNTYCFVNKTSLLKNTYTYRIYVNDSLNNTNVSVRTVTIVDAAFIFLNGIVANRSYEHGSTVEVQINGTEYVCLIINQTGIGNVTCGNAPISYNFTANSVKEKFNDTETNQTLVFSGEANITVGFQFFRYNDGFTNFSIFINGTNSTGGTGEGQKPQNVSLWVNKTKIAEYKGTFNGSAAYLNTFKDWVDFQNILFNSSGFTIIHITVPINTTVEELNFTINYKSDIQQQIELRDEITSVDSDNLIITIEAATGTDDFFISIPLDANVSSALVNITAVARTNVDEFNDSVVSSNWTLIQSSSLDLGGGNLRKASITENSTQITLYNEKNGDGAGSSSILARMESSEGLGNQIGDADQIFIQVGNITVIKDDDVFHSGVSINLGNKILIQRLLSTGAPITDLTSGDFIRIDIDHDANTGDVYQNGVYFGTTTGLNGNDKLVISAFIGPGSCCGDTVANISIDYVQVKSYPRDFNVTFNDTTGVELFFNSGVFNSSTYLNLSEGNITDYLSTCTSNPCPVPFGLISSARYGDAGRLRFHSLEVNYSGTAENLSIDVGNDGIVDKNWTGSFSVFDTDYFDFTASANAYLRECNATSGFQCDIPVKVSMDSVGAINFTDLIVRYDPNPFPLNLTPFISYLGNSTENAVHIPLEIESRTEGIVNLFNLSMYFNGDENITIDIGTSTTIARVKYSVYNLSLPVDFIEFIPDTQPFNESKNVSATGQGPAAPLFNITAWHSYSGGANYSLHINDTHACVNMTWSNTSTPQPSQILGYDGFVDVIHNLSFEESVGIWLFTDFDCNLNQFELFLPNIFIRACAANSTCANSTS